MQFDLFFYSAFNEYNTDQFTPAKVENDTVSSAHICGLC